MLDTTQELQVAQRWAADSLGKKNAAKYYLSEENFIAAYLQNGSFSFIVKGEPFYGQMYGQGAYFDDRCTDLAIEGEKPDHIGTLLPQGGFQFWEALTVQSAAPIELLSDPDEIAAILTEHAPDASVAPGGPEEIFWGGVRNDSGEVAALAVIVKWQSGLHVMASVVTREQDRGRGYATKLSEGMLAHAHDLGIERVGLGVRDVNSAAQRVYEKAGFKKLADFTHYSQE